MFRKLGIGFAALAMLAPSIASALGVGDYTLKSYLNQSFNMEVELLDVGDLTEEEVLASLAGQEEFDAAGVERVYFLTDLDFRVVLDADSSGTLYVTSSQPVREPFLNFLVEFLWPTGRLLREYTILLDPPSYLQEVDEEPPQPAVTAEPVQQVFGTESLESKPIPTQPAVSSEPRTVAQSQSPRPSAPIEVLDRQEYLVQTNDTMWRIALNNRPVRSISVQQMLVAIQALNEDAFIDGNVNLVREGTVLRLPTEEEVRRISTRDALDEIAGQNREWRAKLEARGIKLPTRPQLDATRRTTTDKSADAGALAEEGQLTLVSPDAGEGGGAAVGGQGGGGIDGRALENELAISDEQVDQLKRENGELSSRLNDLSQQAETSEKLLQLRNDQIAQLQDQLRRLQEQQGTLPTEPVAVEPVELTTSVEPTQTEVVAETLTGAGADTAAEEAAVQGEEEQQSGESVADQSGEEDVALSETAASEGVVDAVATGADATTSTAEVTTEATAPAEITPVPQSTSASLLSFLNENLPLVIGAGVALVTLVFGGLFVAARRRKAAAEELADNEYDSYDEEDDFLGMDSDGEEKDSFDLDDIDDIAAQGSGDAAQDPMEEVEVYTAYGRHAEAVTFLKNEIQKSPDRSDLKVRLLEVLVETRDADGFTREAQALSGDKAVAARLPDMRAQLGIAAGVAAAESLSQDQDQDLSLDDLEFDLAADMEPKRPTEADSLEFETDASDDTLVLDGLDGDDSFDLELDSGEDSNAMATSDDGLSLGDLDEEISFDLDEIEDEKSEDPEKQKALDEALNVEPALDLTGSDAAQAEDVDFGEIELNDASEEFSEASEQLASEELDLSLDDDELSLELDDSAGNIADDFDLDGGDELSLEAASDDLELSLEGDDLTDADLLLSLEDDLSPEEEATAVGMPSLDEPSATVQRESIDDLGIDAGKTDSQAPIDASGDIEFVDDDGDFELLGDSDENATKLDLAKAYIDMGDAEGAKDILSEVLAEGSPEQQAEAKGLISQAG